MTRSDTAQLPQRFERPSVTKIGAGRLVGAAGLRQDPTYVAAAVLLLVCSV